MIQLANRNRTISAKVFIQTIHGFENGKMTDNRQTHVENHQQSVVGEMYIKKDSSKCSYKTSGMKVDAGDAAGLRMLEWVVNIQIKGGR